VGYEWVKARWCTDCSYPFLLPDAEDTSPYAAAFVAQKALTPLSERGFYCPECWTSESPQTKKTNKRHPGPGTYVLLPRTCPEKETEA